MAKRVRERAIDCGFNQKTLANQLVVSTSSLGLYWHGKRPWPTELLTQLAAALEWSTDVLLGWSLANEPAIGSIAAILRAHPEWDVRSVEAALTPAIMRLAQGSGPDLPQDDAVVGHTADALDLVEVGEIDLAYGLGGTYSDGPILSQTLHFPRSWIESITTTPAAMLTIARGRGDSMQPTIQDGDMVLIDRSQRTIREQDAIWALTIGDFAMIKRVRAGGERVRILSDNDRVPPDEVFHEEINVVGRVVFIGRRL